MPQPSEEGPTRDRARATTLGCGKPMTLGRRSFLRGALLSAADMVITTQMSGCSASSSRLQASWLLGSGRHCPADPPRRAAFGTSLHAEDIAPCAVA
jgi:hypothetical protein